MNIIINVKNADDIIGLKEDISARLEDIVEIDRIDVCEEHTKEITSIATIEITTITKDEDETDLSPIKETEALIKNYIEGAFRCDNVNVKLQRFIRD